MTDEQILSKALHKYLATGGDDQFLNFIVDSPKHVTLIDADGVPFKFNVEAIIFNHEFAQAIWPGKEQTFNYEEWYLLPFEYHLTKMVTAKNPIQYLGANL